MSLIQLQHLGFSGISLAFGGGQVAIDPPAPTPLPTVITWSEAERVAGVRGGRCLAAPSEILEWIGLPGRAIEEGASTRIGGFNLEASRYPTIPYATAPEALRKSWSAVRNPARAAVRLSHTLRRPKGLPVALSFEAQGIKVALLGQALHRFLSEEDLVRLVDRHGGADLLIAGTDYEDEEATGRLMGRFGARICVLADLIGPVRRKIGLPVRPLNVVLAAAPAGTRLLEEGQHLDLEAA